MSHIPGTVGSFKVDMPEGVEPEPGWTLRSGPSGACYRVMHVRPIAARVIEPGKRRWELTAERLGYDALDEHEADDLMFPAERGRR